MVTVVGTVAWAIALVVALTLRAQIPAGSQWWIWTCVAGVGMGLFALWYVPRFKRARARKAQRRAETRAVAAAQPCSSDSKTVSSTETPGTSTRS
jgi:ribosomal protein L32